MSWIPPSSAGLWDPQSRNAPRPAAAAPAFTFGHLEEKQQHAAAGGGKPELQSISHRPERACFDPPVEQLRWWQQGRNDATVAGTANKDVEAFWKQARQEGGDAALPNTNARKINKAQGTSSTVAASMGDREQFNLTQAQSAYKSDMCTGHVKVGKRGVVQSAEAMQAYEESRKQAERNKKVGKSTNMQLSLF